MEIFSANLISNFARERGGCYVNCRLKLLETCLESDVAVLSIDYDVEEKKYDAVFYPILSFLFCFGSRCTLKFFGVTTILQCLESFFYVLLLLIVIVDGPVLLNQCFPISFNCSFYSSRVSSIFHFFLYWCKHIKEYLQFSEYTTLKEPKKKRKQVKQTHE